MISVKEALKNIMSARYGEEVRTSIHDAIYQMDANANEAVDVAITSKDSAKASASMAKTSELQSKSYSEDAQSKYEIVRDLFEGGIPDFRVNLETGDLEYEGTDLRFIVNDNGDLCWDVI